MAQHNRALAQQLLRQGSGTLGYWTTWPGNHYWSSSDGKTVVAYRVSNRVALALTEPLTDGEFGEDAVQEFVAFCEAHRWIPAFYSIQQESLGSFTSLGWRTVEVGQETLVPLADFDINAKEWQKVRHAVNRASRSEVMARWTTWQQLTHAERAQIQHISRQWEVAKKISHMGFTIGGLNELKGTDVALMIGVDSEGIIHGVTSWLPVYKDGKIIGRTLDFMRRGANGFNGITEFLIGSTAQKLLDEGLTVMSLSGVPLAYHLDDERAKLGSTTDRVLAIIAQRLEPVYGFSGLFFYKQKFNPVLKPLYLVYPEQNRLPRVVLAVGKAYLPNFTGRHFWAALRLLVT